MLMTILGMVAPLVTKALGSLVDRAFQHWKSSTAGVVGAGGSYAAVYVVLEQMGCNLDNINLAAGVAALVPVILGLVGVDKSKVLSASVKGNVTTIVEGEQVNKDGNPIPRS